MMRLLILLLVACGSAIAGTCNDFSLGRLKGIDSTPAVRIDDEGAAVLEIPAPVKRFVVFTRFDLSGPFDLSDCGGLEFDYWVSSEVGIYNACVLMAAPGWKGYYSLPMLANKGKDAAGWRHMRVAKGEATSFTGELTDGFAKLGTLRFYFNSNNGFTRDVTIRIRNLRALPKEDLATDAWVVDGDITFPTMKLASAGFIPSSRWHAEALRACGYTVATVRESDFPETIPAAVRLVVLPYNRHLPVRVQQKLEAFVARGGRLVLARHQESAWRQKMLATGRAVNVAFTWASLPVSEISATYAQWMKEWFPDLSGKVAARLAADRARAETERAEIARCRSDAKGFRVFLDCHNAWGPTRGKEPWEKSVRFAAEHGVTDLIVNFSWAAEADYVSEVLAPTDDLKRNGDGLVECLAACRKYGVKLHAWRCCWALSHRAPKELVTRLRNEGRFQRNAKGDEIVGWLCPNHPANHRQHVEAMVELAKKGVDGIDYDFIRYNCAPAGGCFCSYCRAAFEKELGRSIANWPADVIGDQTLLKAWGDFRCRSIGRGIRAIAERVHRECPGVEISTTGGGDWKVCPLDWNLGRDWGTWAKNGWVDFIFLMDYAYDVDSFRAMVELQRAAEIGKAFIVPGLGPSCWPVVSAENDARRIVDQARVLKELGITSLGLFEYGDRANAFLPLVWP